ncbi:hypothetical protein VCRA2116O30_100088 [Vibrio crassostreae]|nr:hypothetical protein VCRA2116O30_100088 [Vibrio crassostreae]CAK1701173.1 hypothetical protein VCRA2119O45_100088 [Vibrio crassostreae]CAK1863443.1 hypothetical protein VCRA2118O41_10350 [Vibrio crassostreae]CAK1876216.1 hypothetical protein VCRA2119O46_10369 [Vibrio crassostreae]CAK1877134.1 hypothetical protein VCRA2116O28_10433 [Vibrio crassostreae]
MIFLQTSIFETLRCSHLIHVFNKGMRNMRYHDTTQRGNNNEP